MPFSIGAFAIIFAFTCRVVGGQLAPSNEADESRYFQVRAIPSNTIPKQVERIHDAIGGGAQPIFRTQACPSTREWLRQERIAGGNV